MSEQELQYMRQELVRLRQEIAIRPIRVPTRGGSGGLASVPTIFEITDGETITALNRIGILRVTVELDDTDLPTVTIPVSVPDGGIYVVPANPTPAGLPSGLGVGRQIGAETYGFVLNDSRATPFWDVVQSDRVWTPTTVTIDKVQGLKTARWILNVIRHQL